MSNYWLLVTLSIVQCAAVERGRLPVRVSRRAGVTPPPLPGAPALAPVSRSVCEGRASRPRRRRRRVIAARNDAFCGAGGHAKV